MLAWQRAKGLALAVYKVCDKYPKHEIFGLTNQTTRAAVSIIANIAEGTSRKSSKDFRHFLEISLGSAYELETLLIIASERKYLNNDSKLEIDNLLQDTIKLTCGLMRKLNA